jgi:hypothetical protein
MFVSDKSATNVIIEMSVIFQPGSPSALSVKYPLLPLENAQRFALSSL